MISTNSIINNLVKYEYLHQLSKISGSEIQLPQIVIKKLKEKPSYRSVIRINCILTIIKINYIK